MTYEEKRDYLNRYQSALARARELTEDIARPTPPMEKEPTP